MRGRGLGAEHKNGAGHGSRKHRTHGWDTTDTCEGMTGHESVSGQTLQAPSLPFSDQWVKLEVHCIRWHGNRGARQRVSLVPGVIPVVEPRMHSSPSVRRSTSVGCGSSAGADSCADRGS
jgi:hypothetical protein